MLNRKIFKRKLAQSLLAVASATLLLNAAHAANSDVKITEYMYAPSSAAAGEFVEFTNLGSTAVDFTGWSYSDSARTPGDVSLSGFGIVNAGESVILTEVDAATFRATWNLSSSVKVIGPHSNDNLGRSDEINIYDASNTQIDRLTYNDQGTGTVKGPRTNGTSARPGSVAALGANNASLWVLSTIGNLDGAHLSTSGDIGSPGTTSYASPVPLGSSETMMLSALGLLGTVARRRNRAA